MRYTVPNDQVAAGNCAACQPLPWMGVLPGASPDPGAAGPDVSPDCRDSSTPDTCNGIAKTGLSTHADSSHLWCKTQQHCYAQHILLQANWQTRMTHRLPAQDGLTNPRLSMPVNVVAVVGSGSNFRVHKNLQVGMQDWKLKASGKARAGLLAQVQVSSSTCSRYVTG
jgi:hypothetical protein